MARQVDGAAGRHRIQRGLDVRERHRPAAPVADGRPVGRHIDGRGIGNRREIGRRGRRGPAIRVSRVTAVIVGGGLRQVGQETGEGAFPDGARDRFVRQGPRRLSPEKGSLRPDALEQGSVQQGGFKPHQRGPGAIVNREGPPRLECPGRLRPPGTERIAREEGIIISRIRGQARRLPGQPVGDRLNPERMAVRPGLVGAAVLRVPVHPDGGGRGTGRGQVADQVRGRVGDVGRGRVHHNGQIAHIPDNHDTGTAVAPDAARCRSRISGAPAPAARARRPGDGIGRPARSGSSTPQPTGAPAVDQQNGSFQTATAAAAVIAFKHQAAVPALPPYTRRAQPSLFGRPAAAAAGSQIRGAGANITRKALAHRAGRGGHRGIAAAAGSARRRGIAQPARAAASALGHHRNAERGVAASRPVLRNKIIGHPPHAAIADHHGIAARRHRIIRCDDNPAAAAAAAHRRAAAAATGHHQNLQRSIRRHRERVASHGRKEVGSIIGAVDRVVGFDGAARCTHGRVHGRGQPEQRDPETEKKPGIRTEVDLSCHDAPSRVIRSHVIIKIRYFYSLTFLQELANT